MRSLGAAVSLLAALLITACVPGKPAFRLPSVPAAAFARGVVYPSYQAGEYASGESDAALAEAVRPLGVNWVSVVVTCYQQSVTATQIDCHSSGSATDDDLTHAIAVAHRQGLKVMLSPHIDPRDYPTHWRGEIAFGNDAAQWKAWFTSYTALITHYAALAQAAGAEMFVVGSELQGTSARADDWRAVVAAVRHVYSGTLTYAANHGEETAVRWWDALDAIGVDGYYALTGRDDPTLAQVRAAWQPIVRQLADLAGTWHRPILLTEIGYQSRAGTNRTPWQVDDATLDVQEQATCYQAVFDVFAHQPWLLGMFWWEVLPTRDQGGATNTDFTPIGKPAAAVLRGNYLNPP